VLKELLVFLVGKKRKEGYKGATKRTSTMKESINMGSKMGKTSMGKTMNNEK